MNWEVLEQPFSHNRLSLTGRILDKETHVVTVIVLCAVKLLQFSLISLQEYTLCRKLVSIQDGGFLQERKEALSKESKNILWAL